MTGTETTPSETTTRGDAAARAAFVRAETTRRSLSSTPPVELDTAGDDSGDVQAGAPAPIDPEAAARDAAALVRLALRLGARFFGVTDDGAADTAAEFGRRLGPTLAGWLGGALPAAAGIASLVEWGLERVPTLPREGGRS